MIVIQPVLHYLWFEKLIIMILNTLKYISKFFIYSLIIYIIPLLIYKFSKEKNTVIN